MVSVLRRRQIAASETIEGLVHKGLQLAAAAPADSAASESGLAQVEADIRLAAQAVNIREPELEALVVHCMEGALEQMLEDGHLSHSEERAVGAVLTMFDIRAGTHAENSVWTKMIKFATLRDLTEGTLPKSFAHVQVPFRMMKSENLIWEFQGEDYRLTRTRREFRGGSVGVNVRVARGIYLRQSSFRGRPVEVNESVHMDTRAYWALPPNRSISLVPPAASGSAITRLCR